MHHMRLLIPNTGAKQVPQTPILKSKPLVLLPNFVQRITQMPQPLS